jgi:hypothetical protein
MPIDRPRESGRSWSARSREEALGQREPFGPYRLRHGLNSGVPQVRSHRATSSCGMVGAPALIAAHRRSSSSSSSGESATGAPSNATIPAISSATDRPRSAANDSSVQAVASSTSIVRVFAVMTSADHDRPSHQGISQIMSVACHSAATPVSSSAACISRRSHSGAMSKPFGQVGAPNSRNTRPK